MGNKTLKCEKDFVVTGDAKTFFGLAITYVRKNFSNKADMIKQTIIARFLPYVLSKDHPEYRAICLMCISDLESWTRAIREYSGLNPVPYSYTSPSNVIASSEEIDNLGAENIESVVGLNFNSFKLMINQLVTDKDLFPEDQLEKLIQLKPDNESDWTDDHWDLWEEETDRLQQSIEKSRLGVI